ncbi:unnamed protein product [Psylliodes chrysocephalus]|uniref:C-type lectin domain-containing protein n=1 Tax=Psylliodes chrysocephalus TaxID=3402493 RepID=A0A9P0G962_9CUCU|nr:unnamed protein product [Psylliodes chrysocephala]
MNFFLATWCVFICFTTTFAYLKNDTQLWSHTLKLGAKTFFINFEAISFDDAIVFCRAHSMQLAAIENLNENTILVKDLKKISVDGTTELWTSGKKLNNSNDWIWLSTMDVIESFDWGAGEPNNEEGNEFCLAIYPNYYSSGSWNDANCQALAYPICQSVSSN